MVQWKPEVRTTLEDERATTIQQQAKDNAARLDRQAELQMGQVMLPSTARYVSLILY
jgi:hypothetical protein